MSSQYFQAINLKKGDLFGNIFLLQMLSKQQIQQMSIPNEESGIFFFDKIKHMFFDGSTDDQEIISIIRADPFKSVGNMFLHLTLEYNKKVEDIVEPLEDEKNNLIAKLKETRQNLHNYIEENQILKNNIDQLEEQRYKINLDLNQSRDEIQSAKQGTILQILQKEELKRKVSTAKWHIKQLQTENSHLKNMIEPLEKDIATINGDLQKLKCEYDKIVEINKQLKADSIKMAIQRRRIEQQNEQMQIRIQEKDDFIASFIDQYNKCHLFNQPSTGNKAYIIQQSQDTEKDQLKNLNFNIYETDSHSSQASNRKNKDKKIAEVNLDEKFQFINTTAQKIKPKIVDNKIYVSDEKQYNRLKYNIYENKYKLSSKNKNSQQNKLSNQIKDSNKLNKTIMKTVSSKNLHSNESMNQSSPYEGSDCKMMQSILHKKLSQKNRKIAKLEHDTKQLKTSFIQQRQNITIMQGEYQLEIEELKDRLQFTKKQLSNTYQKYKLIEVECNTFKDRVEELEYQLQKEQLQYCLYCQQLKKRCKAYVSQKIGNVEKEYQSLKNILIEYTASKKRQSRDSSIQIKRQQIEEFHAQFKEEDATPIESDSNIDSYLPITNHYLQQNKMTFSKSSNNQQNNVEILEKDIFEIQSEWHTQRLILQNISKSGLGSLADCLNAPISQFIILPHQNIPALGIVSNIYSELLKCEIQRKLCIYSQVNEHELSPFPKKLSNNNNLAFTYSPQKTCQLSLSPNIINLHFEQFSNTKSLINKSKNLKMTNVLKIDQQIKQIHNLKINQSFSINQVIKKERNSKMCQLQYLSLPKNRPSCKSISLDMHSIPKRTQENAQTQTIMSVLNLDSNVVTLKHKVTKYLHLVTSPIIQINCQLSKQRKMKIHPHDLQYHYMLKKTSQDRSICGRTYIQVRKHGNAYKIIQLFSYSICSEKQYSCAFIQTEKIQAKPIYHLMMTRSIQMTIYNEGIFNSPTEINAKQKQAKLTFARASSFSTNLNSEQITIQPLQQDNLPIQPYQNQPNLLVQQSQQQIPLSVQQAVFQENQSPCLHGAFFLLDIPSEIANLTAVDEKITSNNPENKSYRCRRGDDTQINISPWFFDDKKEKKQSCCQINEQQVQIASSMNQIQLQNLQKYLQAHNISITVQNTIYFHAFQKPKQIKHKIYLFMTVRNDKKDVFMINSHRILNLSNNLYIKYDRSQHHIDQNNFMFGQSEVIVAGDKKLIIKRNGKRNKLVGDLEDGIWQIEYFIMCKIDSSECIYLINDFQ